MIISDTEKFVFMHNPKVGGMTFRTALMPFETRENFYFEWKHNAKINRTLDMAHITALQFRNLYPEDFASVAGYLKFGFVRNPYTRFLSALSQHLKLATPYLRNAILRDPAVFYGIADQFALHVLEDAKIGADHRLVHFRRQSAYFYLDGAQWADHVIPLETASEALQEPMRHWIGDSVDQPRNITTQFEGKGYDVAALSRPAVERINAFYAQDFRRFGYEMV